MVMIVKVIFGTKIKKMKKILLLTSLAFMLAACNKCKECTMENYNGIGNQEWTVYDENSNDFETFGDQIIEVCSDNFESKKEFNDFIDAIEDEDGAECKSDFWN